MIRDAASREAGKRLVDAIDGLLAQLPAEQHEEIKEQLASRKDAFVDVLREVSGDAAAAELVRTMAAWADEESDVELVLGRIAMIDYRAAVCCELAFADAAEQFLPEWASPVAKGVIAVARQWLVGEATRQDVRAATTRLYVEIYESCGTASHAITIAVESCLLRDNTPCGAWRNLQLLVTEKAAGTDSPTSDADFARYACGLCARALREFAAMTPIAMSAIPSDLVSLKDQG